MGRSLSRVYWDACCWISYIQREMPRPGCGFTERRFDLCSQTLKTAIDKQVEVVTSAFTLAEVCKMPTSSTSPSVNLPAFFDQPYIFLVNVDKVVGQKAQSLQLSGIGSLKPQDATHIATAQVANIPIFHTFDRKLLSLDKLIKLNDGNMLRVVMPTHEAPPLPLLAGLGGE